MFVKMQAEIHTHTHTVYIYSNMVKCDQTLKLNPYDTKTHYAET